MYVGGRSSGVQSQQGEKQQPQRARRELQSEAQGYVWGVGWWGPRWRKEARRRQAWKEMKKGLESEIETLCCHSTH